MLSLSLRCLITSLRHIGLLMRSTCFRPSTARLRNLCCLSLLFRSLLLFLLFSCAPLAPSASAVLQIRIKTVLICCSSLVVWTLQKSHLFNVGKFFSGCLSARLEQVVDRVLRTGKKGCAANLLVSVAARLPTHAKKTRCFMISLLSFHR